MTQTIKKMMKLKEPWYFVGMGRRWEAGDVVEVLGPFQFWPGFVNAKSKINQYYMIPEAFLEEV